MPCTVTAFSVKIALPGDTAMESIIAREVIGTWNALHALEQKQILLPLDGEEARENPPSDLLVSFFCAACGTPDEPRGSDPEIDKQLDAGRPALIYFSEGRVDLLGTHALQARAMDGFKKRYSSQATIDSYGDEKEFRAKFARQLEATIRGHIYFRSDAPAPSADPAPPPAEEKLSPSAQTLLSEACEDFEAYIGRMKIGNTLKIQANGKQLVEQGNPESAALWEGAFQELLTGGYIRDAGCNGQLFQISTKGFDFLKSIGKTPVGYIAELGGM
jgi:hypothetical protein